VRKFPSNEGIKEGYPLRTAGVGTDWNCVQAEVVNNKDQHMTYSCSYIPTVEGQYTVDVKFAGQHIPKSPFIVGVEGKAGDPSKVTASGPGLEQNGVVENSKTHFEVYTKGRTSAAL